MVMLLIFFLKNIFIYNITSPQDYEWLWLRLWWRYHEISIMDKITVIIDTNFQLSIAINR